MQGTMQHPEDHKPANRRAVYALMGLSAVACMGAAAMMTSVSGNWRPKHAR